MKRLGRAVLAVCGAVFGAVSPAWAQYRHRVVLLESTGDAATAEVQARVRGELAGAGFEVVALPLGAGEDAERRADAAAGELHPAAVLYVVAAPEAENAGARSLFISDRLLHKSYLVRFRGDAQAPPNQAAQVAVQAVEILNADLAELSLTRATPSAPAGVSAPPVRETPAPLAAEAPRRMHAELQAGAGVLEGFQGTGAAWTPIVRLGVNVPERWLSGAPIALSALVSVAAFGGEVTVATPDGEARLSQALGDVEVVANLLPHAPFEPFLLIESGAYTLRGQGTHGDVVHGARTWTATSGGGAGLRAVVGPRFALVVSGEFSFAWSRSIVRIAEREVATAGSPVALYGATAVGVF